MVKQHEATYEPGVIRNFIDIYIRHMRGGGLLPRITFQGTKVTTSWHVGFLV